MTTERYPRDIRIDHDDFVKCGYKEVLALISLIEYPSIWKTFSKAARKAIMEDRVKQGKIFWLLADACSMRLQTDSPNEPFKSYVPDIGVRSIIPNDFTEEDIVFFSNIVDIVENVWLKARLADLVWLLKKPRDVRFAITAIDAYRSIPLDVETWIHGGDVCWRRALSLARILKTAAGDRLKSIEDEIFKVFDSATQKDGFLAWWLSETLLDYRLGSDRAGKVAQKLNSLATTFESEGELHRAHAYFDAAVKWFLQAKEYTKSVDVIISLAESWVKEAIARQTSDKPSNIVAASFYEKAIQIYRRITRSERIARNLDVRISELRIHMEEAGRRSLDEMHTITTPGIDISQFVKTAYNVVRGKSVVDALNSFINLHKGACVKELRQDALEQIRNNPILTLFPATMVSRDGRVIAKNPGIVLSGEPTSEDESVIRKVMIQNYGIMVGIIVQGFILPALEVLIVEHRLREADFIHLSSQSPIVPYGRERLFGKAVFAGYECDFVTALHLMVPQIEHMVRWHLKEVGVKTTSLDQNGIETENGLCTLIDMPEAINIFGEDIVFEISALYCGKFGKNLRNDLAHGLLDDSSCQSVYSIYAWWLCLKLILINYWNSLRKAEGEPEDGEMSNKIETK
jgi:hypothetical protein